MVNPTDFSYSWDRIYRDNGPRQPLSGNLHFLFRSRTSHLSILLSFLSRFLRVSNRSPHGILTLSRSPSTIITRSCIGSKTRLSTPPYTDVTDHKEEHYTATVSVNKPNQIPNNIQTHPLRTWLLLCTPNRCNTREILLAEILVTDHLAEILV